MEAVCFLLDFPTLALSAVVAGQVLSAKTFSCCFQWTSESLFVQLIIHATNLFSSFVPDSILHLCRAVTFGHAFLVSYGACNQFTAAFHPVGCLPR